MYASLGLSELMKILWPCKIAFLETMDSLSTVSQTLCYMPHVNSQFESSLWCMVNMMSAIFKRCILLNSTRLASAGLQPGTDIEKSSLYPMTDKAIQGYAWSPEMTRYRGPFGRIPSLYQWLLSFLHCVSLDSTSLLSMYIMTLNDCSQGWKSLKWLWKHKINNLNSHANLVILIVAMFPQSEEKVGCCTLMPFQV